MKPKALFVAIASLVLVVTSVPAGAAGDASSRTALAKRAVYKIKAPGGGGKAAFRPRRNTVSACDRRRDGKPIIARYKYRDYGKVYRDKVVNRRGKGTCKAIAFGESGWQNRIRFRACKPRPGKKNCSRWKVRRDR